ncbi:MAG: polysaccharide biosynthesis C-terminal domain-containing protein [Saprospiraceae bacterium]|nr:polysaccharide biosynthesis C-terminal domain-containing protein [Candidatus Brachybacter algidus]
MSVLKKLAGETIYYGLSSIVGRFISFFLTPMYTYSVIIDIPKMGHLTELMAYTGMLLILFTCRMEASYFRFGKEKEHDKAAFDNSLTTVFSISIFLALIIFFAAPWIAPALGYAGEEVYFRLLAGIMMLDAFCEIPLSRLRFEGKAKQFATTRLFNIFVNVVFNIFFVIVCPWLYAKNVSLITFWFDPEFIIAYIFLAQVFGSLTSSILLGKYFKGLGNVDWKLLNRMIKYSWPLVIVSLVAMFNEMFGRIILKWFLNGTLAENEFQLGIYGANYRLAMLIALFTQAFRYAAEPFFFRESANKDSTKTYADVAKYYLIFSLYGFLAVTLFIDVFKIFIGPKYYEGLAIVPVLLLANIFSGLYFNVSIWYRLKDKTLTGAFIAIVGAILTLFFNWLLIPRLGYIGSAYATLICYFSITLICYIAGRKHMAVPYQIGLMFFWLAVAVVMQLAFWQIRSIWAPHLVILLMIAMILILAFTAMIWHSEKDKIKLLVAGFKKKPSLVGSPTEVDKNNFQL